MPKYSIIPSLVYLATRTSGNLHIGKTEEERNGGCLERFSRHRTPQFSLASRRLPRLAIGMFPPTAVAKLHGATWRNSWRRVVGDGCPGGSDGLGIWVPSRQLASTKGVRARPVIDFPFYFI